MSLRSRPLGGRVLLPGGGAHLGTSGFLGGGSYPPATYAVFLGGGRADPPEVKGGEEMLERGLWQSISSVKSLFLTNNFIDLKK